MNISSVFKSILSFTYVSYLGGEAFSPKAHMCVEVGKVGINTSFELRTDIMEETLHGNIDLFP